MAAALAAALGAARAGLLGVPTAVGYTAAPVFGAPAYGSPAFGSPAVAVRAPAVATQTGNIVRTPGNLGQVSTQSKTVDTAFSSVRKADVRVSNDALAFPGGTVHAVHAAPPVAYAGPGVAKAAAPAGAAAAGHALLGVAYSAAPAVAHMTFDGLGISYAY
ncbi:hypothetical protein R5R35_008867 [Gryllus longicercus]|uniref:Pupal cuticle protein C1B n=1 Tax=Gryllus longicercus TaxID=2509291 RepID=A0AAN9V8P5_9ORTH